MGRRRRLPRLLLNAATAVSLALGVVVVFLWALSNWTTVGVASTSDLSGGNRFEVTTRLAFADAGLIHWIRSDSQDAADAPDVERYRADARWRLGWRWVTEAPAGSPVLGQGASAIERMGFSDKVTLTRMGLGWTIVQYTAVPCWGAAVVTGGLPGARALRWWRRRKLLRAGRCLACGYDLRATPNHCPECGTAPPPAAR